MKLWGCSSHGVLNLGGIHRAEAEAEGRGGVTVTRQDPQVIYTHRYGKIIKLHKYKKTP